jgi:multiple sugar transport system ATP-binding protein
MSRIEFQGISKYFGDVVGVEDLNLSIDDGEFLVLLGPSGCGKSTALRLVAGLEEPSAGAIIIGDRVVNGIEAKNRNIAMVFQSYALYPHMTVRRNLEFPLRTRHVPQEARARIVADAARWLGLEELLDRRPAELSGGQRQRVALGRAIVRRPEAFLMDEPLSNLDATLRVKTRSELVAMHRELETTFIYVTHDQVEAMTMASRIAVMQKGRLQQTGSPQSVYEEPANTFVAQFIGSPPMNIVPGEVRRDGELLGVDVAGGRIPLPPEQAVAVAQLGLTHVLVGVRPEHMVIGDGPVHASVRAVESLGHERHILCDLSPEQMVIVRLSADVAPPAAADVIQLTADPRHLHLFDADTTRRIGA